MQINKIPLNKTYKMYNDNKRRNIQMSYIQKQLYVPSKTYLVSIFQMNKFIKNQTFDYSKETLFQS